VGLAWLVHMLVPGNFFKRAAKEQPFLFGLALGLEIKKSA
jgi:hypothetical protein